jgi:cold shock CspA family protein
MTIQRELDWDIAPTYDQGVLAGTPAVLPVARKRPTRFVGIVRNYTPRKSFGLVEAMSKHEAAIFNIEDVVPKDRARIDCGQTVTFEMVAGPDGHAAKQIRIDGTTLPPPPDDEMISKGWR